MKHTYILMKTHLKLNCFKFKETLLKHLYLLNDNFQIVSIEDICMLTLKTNSK